MMTLKNVPSSMFSGLEEEEVFGRVGMAPQSYFEAASTAEKDPLLCGYNLRSYVCKRKRVNNVRDPSRSLPRGIIMALTYVCNMTDSYYI